MSQVNHTKRLCIFAHFDKDNILDPYVLFYLQEIRKVADRLVFVSTASLAPETLATLKPVCDAVLIRKNEGYDFAGWKFALQSEAEALNDYDELILCNDSVYGPFFPLEQIFSEMKGNACDFWGITSNYDIAYHVQSYFLVFRKTVLVSSAFQKFWKEMEIQKSKKNVIKHGEVHLSQTLLKAGFRASTYTRHRLLLSLAIVYSVQFFIVKVGIRIRKELNVLFVRLFHSRREDHLRKSLAALIKEAVISAGRILCKIKNTIGKGFHKIFNFILHPGKKFRRLILFFELRLKAVNVTHFLWKQLILYNKMPFIKVDLLRDNPMGVDIGDYKHVISRVSNYNASLIANHLSRARKRSGENTMFKAN